MKKVISVLSILAFSLLSCEKDDLCDAKTPTTPRLVIDFYNVTNQTLPKSVTDLKIIGDGMNSGLGSSTSETDQSESLFNGTSVSVPLRTDSNNTTYNFILNAENENSSLTDTIKITFNYTRNNIFISRACGFKTVYTLANEAPVTTVAIPETAAKWMQFISIENNNVENENEAHIKVFF